MLTDEKIIELLHSLHEHIMAKDIFVKVLKCSGLKGVKYTGGGKERGIDIEYYDTVKPDGRLKYTGIQFKKGNILDGERGKKNTISEIQFQARGAFKKKIHNLTNRGTYTISTLIVAATGEINQGARDSIQRARNENEGQQIDYWPGSELIALIRRHWMKGFEDYFNAKLTPIKSEQPVSKIDDDYILQKYKSLVDEANSTTQVLSSTQIEF